MILIGRSDPEPRQTRYVRPIGTAPRWRVDHRDKPKVSSPADEVPLGVGSGRPSQGMRRRDPSRAPLVRVSVAGRVPTPARARCRPSPMLDAAYRIVRKIANSLIFGNSESQRMHVVMGTGGPAMPARHSRRTHPPIPSTAAHHLSAPIGAA